MSTIEEFQIRLSSGRAIPLARGARISAYELSGGWGERSSVNSAEVSEDPHNPKELRLKNLTAQRWIAIMPDGERQEIDYGSSVRVRVGAQINFGTTYGEIVDPKDPPLVRRQPGRSASPPGNFVVRHWRGDLSLTMSFWINGVLFGLVWRVLSHSLLVLQRMAGLRSGTWTILGLIFLGIVGSILTIWTIVGIWRSSGEYAGPAVWRKLARIGAVVLALLTLGQFALAFLVFAL